MARDALYRGSELSHLGHYSLSTSCSPSTPTTRCPDRQIILRNQRTSRWISAVFAWQIIGSGGHNLNQLMSSERGHDVWWIIEVQSIALVHFQIPIMTVMHDVDTHMQWYASSPKVGDHFLKTTFLEYLTRPPPSSPCLRTRAHQPPLLEEEEEEEEEEEWGGLCLIAKSLIHRA